MNGYEFIEYLFGKDANILSMWHMSIRACVIYFLGIILIRLNKRFMGLRTGFNFFLYVLMGSMLASIIIGQTDFIHGIGAIIVILGINLIITFLVYLFPSFEKLLKGERSLLVKNGKILWPAMRNNLITKDELMDAAHNANLLELSMVKEAYFENSGNITIIKKND
ncbi:MAG: YetF domain-containing protein [Candidatus Babeliales bacterium]